MGYWITTYVCIRAGIFQSRYTTLFLNGWKFSESLFVCSFPSRGDMQECFEDENGVTLDRTKFLENNAQAKSKKYGLINNGRILQKPHHKS